MRAFMMEWRYIVTLVLLAVVPGTLGFPGAWALDTESGTLLGVITVDDGSRVIPGAVVEVRNTVTGAIYKSSPADELGMYVSRSVPFGTYDLAVETEEGYFLTADQVAVKDSIPQVLSLALAEDAEEGKKKKGAAWWKTPAGIVIISAAVVGAGLVVANQLDDDEDDPESPANP